MISIIIPVYNAEKYIEKCVDSLVNQTYKNLEIILVNDGSTDNSGSLCDSFAAKDDRIKVIHKQNGGVSSARNAGIDAATGEYMVFPTADSIFTADIMEKCTNEISAHSPDLLVCAIKAPADDNRSKIYIDSNMYTRSEYTENISRYISTGIGFSTVCNKIFSSHIIKSRNMRFTESMPLVADELFNCHYFTIAGHIRCIANLLCFISDDSNRQDIGTTEYLAQGKEYSQKLIDAVQSKGLYGAASQAIGENYQKILYRHLMLLSATNSNCSIQQRVSSLENLSQSSDYAPLMIYLSSLHGIRNQSVYQMFKLRRWKLLLTFLGK